MKRSSTKDARSRRAAVLLADVMRGTFAPIRADAGDILARQGQEARAFYFVESGVLDVVITSDEGLRLPVAMLGPGSHFGEMSLLCGMPVSADVVASEPSVLYAATPAEFDELVRRKPELVEYLAAELDGRPRTRLDETARRKLLSRDFRFGNAEELRQVVKLGADLAESEIVNAEHLFFGAGVGDEVPHVDLLRWPWLERVVTSGYLLTIAKASSLEILILNWVGDVDKFYC